MIKIFNNGWEEGNWEGRGTGQRVGEGLKPSGPTERMETGDLRR